MNRILFSSQSSEWAPPVRLVRSLERLTPGGPFALDPAATPENAKAPRYFTKEDDGLKQPCSGKVFVNPPYGRGIIGPWVEM